MKETLKQIEKDAEKYASGFSEPITNYAKIDFKAGAISQNKWLIDALRESFRKKGYIEDSGGLHAQIIYEVLSSLKITDK